jgi:hypothetical protein
VFAEFEHDILRDRVKVVARGVGLACISARVQACGPADAEAPGNLTFAESIFSECRHVPLRRSGVGRFPARDAALLTLPPSGQATTLQ